jgi:hypothetical protein
VLVDVIAASATIDSAPNGEGGAALTGGQLLGSGTGNAINPPTGPATSATSQ